MKALDLLQDEIKKLIQYFEWNLKPIQEDAISEFYKSTNDIIIKSSTGSGKTEAAFFPVLSNIYHEINNKLKVVYVAPLRALINDQHERLNRFNECDSIHFRVTKWHSDVHLIRKQHFLNKPIGVLLITPESLDSFLTKKGNIELFKHVEHFIIDEFHEFIGGIRGDQLRSVLNRIDNYIEERGGKKSRKILLSATDGSVENTKKWLGNDSAILIENKNQRKEKIGFIKSFDENSRYLKELRSITEEGKHLIFGNSKKALEASLNQLKEIKNEAGDYPKENELGIHHGSLNKKIREKAEQKLKDKTQDNMSVFCTSTLELGIDIGDIDQVSIISPPWTVASFIQQIGRSGRKEDMPIKFNILPIYTDDPDPDFPHLNIGLIQSIALIELMKEGWCEPKNFYTYTYSIFAHQLISLVAQKKQIHVSDLWNQLTNTNVLKKVQKDEFKDIETYFIANKYLYKNDKDLLSLSQEGEELVKKSDFTIVFKTEIQYEIYCQNKNNNKGYTVGEVPIPPNSRLSEGDRLIFAGKEWIVIKKCHNKRQIIVDEYESTEDFKKIPNFIFSKRHIHRNIHRKMLEIYQGDDEYNGYLKADSVKILKEARYYFKQYKKHSSFYPLFLGTRVTDLILFILQKRLGSGNNECSSLPLCTGLNIQSPSSLEIEKVLLNKFSNRQSIEALVDKLPRGELMKEKYDYLLPDSILKKSYIDHQFDFSSYLEFLNSLDKTSGKAA